MTATPTGLTRGPKNYLFDVSEPAFNVEEIVAHLDAFGFVALRNLFPESTIRDVDARAENQPVLQS